MRHIVIDITGEGPEWFDQGGDWHQASCFLDTRGGKWRLRQEQKDRSGHAPP